MFRCAFLATTLASSLIAAAPSKVNTATVKLNTSVRHQQVDGFGCSEAFQRAEDVLGKEGLSSDSQSHLLDLLFSEERGAGFTILRNGIGSSNSSMSNFMNSIEPLSPGSPSAKPHYVWDHYNSGQFPLAQEAYKRGLQTLYADSWSAPGYMKTNNDENYGGLLCGVEGGNNCSTGNWMQAYANYLIQFARFYEQSGVKVTNLGFINEPQETVSYASMNSNGAQAADFVHVLAKTIKDSGMELEINCCDGVGWEEQEKMLPGLQAGPDPAIDYISVITGHGYSSTPNFTLSTHKKTWLTEWADLTGDYTPYTFFENGGPGEGMTWATNIQTAFTKANVSAFLYWIGAENATSNSALISLNNNTIIPSKRYYAFAQFSKFVRPGAQRVEAMSSNPLLTVSSFINKNGIMATQAINNATTDYMVEFQFPSHDGEMFIEPFLTNNGHDLSPQKPIKETGGSFKATVPARSMVSFVMTEKWSGW